MAVEFVYPATAAFDTAQGRTGGVTAPAVPRKPRPRERQCVAQAPWLSRDGNPGLRFQSHTFHWARPSGSLATWPRDWESAKPRIKKHGSPPGNSVWGEGAAQWRRGFERSVACGDTARPACAWDLGGRNGAERARRRERVWRLLCIVKGKTR